MQHRLYYDSLRFVLPFWLIGAVNTAEEEDDLANALINQSIMTVFVEQSLALPRSAK